jgi:hypothetical protein
MASFQESNELISSLGADIVAAGGLVNDSIEFIQSKNEGYGIFARRPVVAGDPVISVPFAKSITVEGIMEYEPLRAIFEDNPGLVQYPDEVLAIGLMHAKLKSGAACPWRKHVATLPLEFNTTIYWSDSELEELKGNAVYHLTQMMKRQIEGDYNSIHRPLSDNYVSALGGLTKDLYTWALSVVYSRSLEITRQGKHTRCIVPVLDMANHNPHTGANPSDTFKYDDATDCISLVAHTNLAPGEQCYAVYGVYPNAKLIYTYGFVVLNNPHRAIDMWVKVPPTTVAAEAKNRFLQGNALTREQTYDFKGTVRPGYVSPALLATIRVIQADENELPLLPRAVQGRMLSVRNEAATYVSLRNFIVARMNVERAQVRLTSTLLLLSMQHINLYNCMNRRTWRSWARCCSMM